MGISIALKRKVIAMYQNGHETEQIAWATGYLAGLSAAESEEMT
jgi:hypothetical protein